MQQWLDHRHWPCTSFWANVHIHSENIRVRVVCHVLVYPKVTIPCDREAFETKHLAPRSLCSSPYEAASRQLSRRIFTANVYHQ